MLDLNANPTTSYSAEQKIWSGAYEQNYYNDDLTIGQIIFRQLQSEPQRIFQISPGENTRLTRFQMLKNAAKVSVYLRKQGFCEDTHIVGILARNTTHLAALAYGCLFNGTPFHAVNHNLEEHTIQNLYSITKPMFICCDAQDYEKLRKVAENLGVTIITVHGRIVGVLSIQEILQATLPDDYEPTRFQRGIDRTMAILCSSGTTGTPKAVTISNSRKIFENHSYLNPDDIQYAPSTLDWLTGLITLITAGVYGTVRLISKEIFSPAHFLKLCEQQSISWSVLAASHIAMLANCPDVSVKELRSLRYLLFAGGHTLVATLHKMQSHLRVEGILRNAYGMTELGTCVSCNYSTHTKPTSVGRLLANIRMRVINDNGDAVGPNEMGELYCHNGQHWSGYCGNSTATAEMQDSDGWFHTGDLGYFDEDNYLHIVERKKDMLKFLGMMYYPHEIEEVIAQMSQVAEVCVFGIWNETEGDAAAASVVPKPGTHLQSAQVEQFVAEKIGVNYKQLNGGALIVQQLAKSANGKVNRKAVKAAYLKEEQNEAADS
ncbi:4-coumarate--CoA ligase 1 [Drosophila grimshawi]|uniref:GH15410 n=1 Tax=Drosophila grimshawi TaxID=7222 RepID=B4JT23_DROGR|nr:4-coumarate--CoA ligase 1 [Drosophila grimshawi]EDV94913.1 GH15410 [Drosophila grimshawi]